MKKYYYLVGIGFLLLWGCKSSVKKTYYPDGHIKETIETKDGVLNGEYCWYNDNGNMQKHGYFKLGKATGYWINYYENGKIRNDGYYKSGMMDSVARSYDSITGKLIREAHYKDSVYNGSCKEFFPDGRLSFEGCFKDGKPDGIFKSYYENGQIKDQGEFKDGLKEGWFTRWYSNGNKKLEMGFENNIQGGAKISYDQDGQKIPSSFLIVWTKGGGDTIRLGETFKARIGDIYYDQSKPASERDKVRVLLGDLDKNDSIIWSSAKDLPIVDGSHAVYTMTPSDTGKHSFSGIMQYTKPDGIVVNAPFRASFYVKSK
jgi:antitoxin component YwqK of YwqJK toxin-antitoxin module